VWGIGWVKKNCGKLKDIIQLGDQRVEWLLARKKIEQCGTCSNICIVEYYCEAQSFIKVVY